MQEIGKIVHLARSGRLVVKLTDELSEGDVLYDQRSNRIGRVAELIGPVSSPFASAIPHDDTKWGSGTKVYVMNSPAGKRNRENEPR